MADTSPIEWTDATWTPIRARFFEIQNDGSGKERIGWHCEHVSEGCRNCYAERMNRRLGTGIDFKPGELYREERKGYRNGEVKLFLDDHMLTAPLRWKKPRMIFVCSMTDLFADFVPDAWIDRVFAVMALSPQHTFQVLTKRSKRMREYINDWWSHRRIYEQVCDMVVTDQMPVILMDTGIADPGLKPAWPRVHLDRWPLPNVWLGVSAERQQEWDERTADLKETPAAVRFVSAEPLLGPIVGDLAGIHWVIVGGESGPDARPMHPDWARALRDQCAAAGVPFFFKQWGEWAPSSLGSAIARMSSEERRWSNEGWTGQMSDVQASEADTMNRVTKKAAGRLLDGVEHNAWPECTP